MVGQRNVRVEVRITDGERLLWSWTYDKVSRMTIEHEQDILVVEELAKN